MKQLRNNPAATFSDISGLNANKNVPWRSQAGLVDIEVEKCVELGKLPIFFFFLISYWSLEPERSNYQQKRPAN